jgi:hypothetical protein
MPWHNSVQPCSTRTVLLSPSLLTPRCYQAIILNIKAGLDKGRIPNMMKKLRGRNLAHPGCFIGVTAGLTLGIVLAAILAAMNVPLNTDLLIWFGLTLGLGAIGWIIGDRLSSRFPALVDQASVDGTTGDGVSDKM